VAEQKSRLIKSSRTTKAEREYRVRKIVQLINAGWGNQQLREYATNEWGLGEKAARSIVAAAYDTMVGAMSQLDLQRIAAICLGRFEQAYRLAVSQRNPMAMIQANAQIAQYWVKHAPEITFNGSGSNVEQDPEEDF
jgi:nucleoid DNA-binding protein